MSKLVKIQYDMSCYNLHDSQTCLNLFRINTQFLKMSRLEMKTWQNTLKFEQMAQEKAKGHQAKK